MKEENSSVSRTSLAILGGSLDAVKHELRRNTGSTDACLVNGHPFDPALLQSPLTLAAWCRDHRILAVVADDSLQCEHPSRVAWSLGLLIACKTRERANVEEVKKQKE